MRHLPLLLGLAACSSHGNAGSPDAPGQTDAEPDASTQFMEAPHPSQPVITNAGGTVLAAPKIVPVFFANDATAKQQIETFLGMMVGSSYWTTISSEYGVGALTLAPSVVATEMPPTTDTALQQLIAAHAGGTGGWPANTPNTIYTVFLPAGVTLTMGGGTSCVQFGGYHNETQGSVVYALVPRCSSTTFPDLQEVTIATSHELLEASTDPHPQSAPAYVQVDDEDAIINLAPGPELGDMCEAARAAYQPMLGGFMVQRQWSNASAAAGHDPCVPVLSTPYVEAAANMQDITISAAGQSLTTRGVKIPLDMSADVEVDLYSDAPTPDFTVVAFDAAQKFRKAPPELQVTLDRSTGNNGDKLKLTVKRVAQAQNFGVSEFVLFTQVGGVTTGMWWGLASQ